MTVEDAERETIALFGEDSFTEYDDDSDFTRYYVGACPTTPGPYQGFMGRSWEEALGFAKEATDRGKDRTKVN